MNEKELIEKLRKKYSANPPEGMTRQDILHMSDGDLLDMDYFLNDEDNDDFGEEGVFMPEEFEVVKVLKNGGMPEDEDDQGTFM